jgi:ribonuclease HI
MHGMVLIYTDGACSGNPGPGGWAWAVAPHGEPQDTGGEAHTTNQRMELTAVIEAIKSVPANEDVEIRSDSTYVVNCFRDEWWKGWLARGWKNSQRQPVANRDLWEPLIELVNARGNVTFSWVKAHNGDPLNELVDQLAVAASMGFSR